MAHDVFISYSTADKALADTVCAGLEQRGLTCWIAPRDILPGSDWGAAIIDAINGAKVMVLIFSSSANTSRQIKREVERAVAKGVSIVPLRVEDVPLGKTLEYFISSEHWMDALSRPLEPHVERLGAAIRALLARPSRQSDFAIPRPTPPPAPGGTPGTTGNLATVAPFPSRPAPAPAPTIAGDPAPAKRGKGRIAIGIAAGIAFLYIVAAIARGGPPHILSVQFPTAIYAGQRATGIVTFEDAKKGVASARFNVLEATNFQGFAFPTPQVAGRANGTISFWIMTPTPQHIALQAVLVDSAGRASKPVPFAFDVQTPPSTGRPSRGRATRDWSIEAPNGFRFKIPR
jgi:hypothetical protein